MGESDSLTALGAPSPSRAGSPTWLSRLGSGLPPYRGFPVRGSASVSRTPQEPSGSPRFPTLLSTHAALFVDPGRPSEGSPIRPLCVGFWHRYTIAACFILGDEAVSRLRGVRSPLRPMWFPVYASAAPFGPVPPFASASSAAATLGTGGWLGLTRQGLPPCKKAPGFPWRTSR